MAAKRSRKSSLKGESRKTAKRSPKRSARSVKQSRTVRKAPAQKETGCCPRFDPSPWDAKVFTWRDKKFVKGRVFAFFNIPVNFGGVIVKIMEKIEAAGAKTPDYMGLSDHTSPFNMDIYVAVDKKVPGLENTTISGTFLTKVYEGPFSQTGKWCKDFQKFASKRKKKIEKMYMWYTTCPKCAKEYGKNYVVIVGQV